MYVEYVCVYACVRVVFKFAQVNNCIYQRARAYTVKLACVGWRLGGQSPRVASAP